MLSSEFWLARVIAEVHGIETNYDPSGDKPLTDALELMNNEGITSLPVVDHQQNVIGNISHVDVRVSSTRTDLGNNLLTII